MNLVEIHQMFELKDTNIEDYSSNFELNNSKNWWVFIKFAEFTSWFDATSQFLEWSLSHHNLMNILEPGAYDGEFTPLGNRLK